MYTVYWRDLDNPTWQQFATVSVLTAAFVTMSMLHSVHVICKSVSAVNVSCIVVDALSLPLSCFYVDRPQS